MTLNAPLRPALSLIAALTALAAGQAQASCGSAFCTLMTDRYAQGGSTAAGGLSLDLRLETVNQSRLREGTHAITAADALAAGEEAIETRTRNTNLITTLGYGLAKDLTLSLRLPFVKRDHVHDAVDDTTTPATLSTEQWRFSKIGDAQVLLRKEIAGSSAASATAVFGGLKLPTGSYKVANGDGAVAERALQPGSGTTDLVVGVAGRNASGLHDATILQASYTMALGKKEEFRPGDRLEASLAWSHAYSHQVGAVLQLNFVHKARDRGDNAEPDLSGSTTLNLSPGLTLALGSQSTLYGYVQLPLYQKVNGIQLVARQALAVGITTDF